MRSVPARLTPVAIVVAALLGGTATMAQTVTIPAGSRGSYSNVVTGPAGGPGQGNGSHPQAGQPAPTPGPLSVELLSGASITDSGAGPTLAIGILGGQGGQGNDSNGGNHDTAPVSTVTGGDGGTGATPGQVTLKLDYFTQVTSSSTAASAVSVQNNGGQGGAAGSYPNNDGISGTPGDGGNGGTVKVDLAGSIMSKNGWSGQTAGTTALAITSIGGDGGPILDNNANQGTARQGTGSVEGHPGGNGGNGGDITVTLTTAGIASQGAGITALSKGGDGGTGSEASVDTRDKATGGNGGAAGSGGTVSATLSSGNVNNPANYQITAVGAATPATGATVQLPDGQTVQTSYSAAAVQLQSFGGSGGAGGTVDGGTAGSGGAAGSAGAVAATISDLNISTTGYSAPAVLAQSIGGSGGDGSPAGGTFRSKTGNGGAGGNAGSVSVSLFDSSGTAPSNVSIIRTAQDDSGGIVAQSIGGGGGSGGDVATGSPIAGVAIGGKGEQGGNGNTVTVNNGDGVDASGKSYTGMIITTQGQRASGITAMSVGGGGGSGGNAQSTVFGPFSYTVGGTSGSGGSAGTPGTTQVSVANAGIIQTTGNHAKGIEALAVGGGGGSGGSASSLTASAQINISMAVGGNGGSGGNAGDVSVTNDGQIVTQGNDAFGVQALSVGGGGGNGGASKAAGYQLVSASDAPSLNFTGSVGGKGAGGGNGGQVTAINNFSIMTGGVGSHGLEAQSIGGGGGNGGDSTGVQQNVKGSTVNINLTLGGSGGVGGSGDTVNVTNNGLIWTQDWFSYGILAQSIGGGGGNGGVGHSDTGNFQNNSGTSGQFALSAGGDGGVGNVGGAVSVNNTGGVITRGDVSRGIFAQSVGGGGGNAGGATANGSSGSLTTKIAIGGAGGAGNVGGTVHVQNSGSVLTGGADSAAIYAQSVGGGGGAGGASAVGGGTNPAKTVADYLQTSVGISSQVQQYKGGIVGWTKDANTGYGVLTKLKGLYNNYQGNNTNAPLPQEGQGGGNLTMNLSIGGVISAKGGSGADGGYVSVDNSGSIATYGPASEGIFAQSVGGGGGDGGAASPTKNTTTSPKKITATLNIGGAGGISGSGGNVIVGNTGTIATLGDQSHGIFGQSIGGGGGSGGLTSSTPTGGQDVNIQMGGNAGMSGAGGNVIVQSLPALQSSVMPSVVTSGDDAVGIAAQSVGGGGGLAALMGTATNADTGGAVSQSSATHFVATGFDMAGKTEVQACAGSGVAYSTATCGDGGGATVDVSNVQTSGRNSHGVLAQSIGGGGGWVLGAGFTGTSFFTQSQPTVGDGGPVTVAVFGAVTTSGDGAYGVLAQSIGGSGLLGGDLASAGNFGIKDFAPVKWTQVSHGNGGNVSVTVNQGASVTTQGANAHAIFAQSVGGGGGLAASDGIGHIGSASGIGTAGAIDVEVNGAVSALGSGSSAIYVNTAGNQTGAQPVTVNVGATGSVTTTNSNTATIVIDSNAASNTVTNAGVINGANALRAVLAATNPVTLNNATGGLLYGAINLGGGSMTNGGSWYLPQGNISVVNTVTNTGSIVVGDGLQVAAPSVLPTLINGQLNSTGVIKTSIDFKSGHASLLSVDGDAQLSGILLINPVTSAANAVNVISVTKSLSVGPLFVRDASDYLYSYSLGNDGKGTLSVTQHAGFTSAALRAGLGANAVSVANHLEANFNAGAPLLGNTFLALSRVTDPTAYRSALLSLGNESTQTVGAARLAASQAFADRMNSCPQVADTGALELRERECLWGRAIDSRTRASGDQAYTQRDQGVQLGGQRRIADGWFLGGSLAYGSNSLSTESGAATVSGNTTSLGVVLKREWNNWLFSGAIDAGHGGYDANRSIAVAGLTANSQSSFGADHAGLHARIAYNVALSDWYVKPYVDLHAVHIRTGSYSESYAAGLGLNVASSSNTTYSATPMLEAGARWALGNGMVLRPYAAIGRAFHSNNNWSSSSQLAGANPAVAPMTIGFDAPRQFTRVKAGLNLAVTKSSELRFEYSGDFASGYRVREGSLRYSYFF